MNEHIKIDSNIGRSIDGSEGVIMQMVLVSVDGASRDSPHGS